MLLFLKKYSVLFLLPLAIMSLIPPGFLSNDDMRMYCWTLGAFFSHEPTSFILYIHIALSWLMKTFSKLTGWHGYSLIYAVSLLLGYYHLILAHKNKIPWIQILWINLSFLLFWAFWNFSLAGFFLLMAIFYRIIAKKPTKILTVIGLFFSVLLALSWRLEMAYIAAFFFLIYLIFLKKIKPAIWITGCLLMGFSWWQLDRFAYNQNPQWQGFKTYNKQRVQALEYSSFNWVGDSVQNTALKNAKWSKINYIGARHWIFQNKSVFNTQNFTAFNKSLPNRKNMSFGQTFDILLNSFFVLPQLLKWLLITLHVLIWVAIRTRKNWVLYILLLLAQGGLQFYLIWFKKPPTDHIWIALTGCLFLIMGLRLSHTGFQNKSRYLKQYVNYQNILIWAVIIISIIWSAQRITERNQQISRANYEFSTLQPKALYIIFPGCFPFEHTSVFHRPPAIYANRAFIMGTAQGWPYTQNIFTDIGANNFSNALFSDKTYIIMPKKGNHIQLLKENLSEANKNLKFELIRESAYFKQIKLFRDPKGLNQH